MKLIYAFPEPLPLARARGVQVAHTVADLARLGVVTELAYVPNDSLHPLGHYGIEVGADAPLTLTPLSRSLPWPFSRVHSNKLFMRRLELRIEGSPKVIVFVRHLKLASLLLERHPGLRLVYEAHEVFSDTASAEKRERQFEMEERVIRGAAVLLANSAATAYRLCELYGNRAIEVLPNGVDWPESLPEKDWTTAAQKIVYAGSFFAWKGVSDLVTAAGELPDCRITFLGGDPAQIAREQAHAAPGGARMDFRGHVRHAEVARVLAGACIAVLPNRDDADSRFTSPIKLYEYMAAGCAVVASDLPALREVLADDDVLWTKPGDPAGIAAAIKRLIGNPAFARRLGERAREKARGHTWRARAERLVGLFKGLSW